MLPGKIENKINVITEEYLLITYCNVYRSVPDRATRTRTKGYQTGPQGLGLKATRQGHKDWN